MGLLPIIICFPSVSVLEGPEQHLSGTWSGQYHFIFRWTIIEAT